MSGSRSTPCTSPTDEQDGMRKLNRNVRVAQVALKIAVENEDAARKRVEAAKEELRAAEGVRRRATRDGSFQERVQEEAKKK